MKSLMMSLAFALVAMLSFGLTGCSTDENLTSAPEMAPVAMKSGKGLMPASGNGFVTVVHGVPGLTVDVYVNGAKTLSSFAPGTITDALELPEGNYDVVIVPVGGDPASPAISGSAFLPAGANVSLVAHLDADGSPKLGVFVNNVADIAPGKSRLVIRHTAAAPAVDASLYRGAEASKYLATLQGLANGGETGLDARPGRYSATLAPAGTKDAVFGPASLVLKPKTSTIVYAVGSLADGSFTLLTQNIALNYGR
jgi:hypothetical protein